MRISPTNLMPNKNATISRASQQWLDFAEGLLEQQFPPLQALVFEKLDALVQASSLVELVKAFLRPYLKSAKGQITQETLNLIMFYPNHRRYKSGKRQGKAPIELWPGAALKADWGLRHPLSCQITPRMPGNRT